MADSPPPKKKAISDWINRPRQDKPDIAAQRRKSWEALTAFIQSNGGHVVSPPGTKSLRVEIMKTHRYQAALLNSATL
jgi:hypothetical protein